MSRRPYPDDLSDAEWALLEPLVPLAKPGGRPRAWPARELLDAIFYVLRAGCAWRRLPHDFPPWQTAYHHFRQWRLTGVWERLNAALRERVRLEAGRNAEPSACILDSQSVKTTERSGPRGYDGAKKVTGRKRHLLVDTNGLVLKVVVLPGNVTDRNGGEAVLTAARPAFPSLRHLLVDGGYKGKWVGWVRETLGWTVEVVQRKYAGRSGFWWPKDEPLPEHLLKQLRGYREFVVIPRRWVVERTFAWLGRYRRLAKDYEGLPETEEALIYAAMIRLTLRRIAKNVC